MIIGMHGLGVMLKANAYFVWMIVGVIGVKIAQMGVRKFFKHFYNGAGLQRLQVRQRIIWLFPVI